MAKEHIRIVKRKGHYESFDEKKVYASVYSACFATQLPKAKCEDIAEKVTKEVKKWASKKKDITSNQIFKIIVNLLKKHEKNLAFMYETHRDIN